VYDITSLTAQIYLFTDLAAHGKFYWSSPRDPLRANWEAAVLTNWLMVYVTIRWTAATCGNRSRVCRTPAGMDNWCGIPVEMKVYLTAVAET